MEVDGTSIELQLWDTLRQDYDYVQLRHLIYSKTHVILICFAVDSPSSLENALEMVRTRQPFFLLFADLFAQLQWSTDANHYCPGVPAILVCCKKDLRHDPGVIERLITPEEVCKFNHIL
jgi:Ras family protein A